MKFEKTCGTCAFGHHTKPLDMTRRHCHGAPPQIITLPQPKQSLVDGKVVTQMTMVLQNMRPVVSAADPACALYRSRDLEDVDPAPPPLELAVAN